MKKFVLKTSIVIILTLVINPKAKSAITLQNIKDLLGKHCYPKEEDCGTVFAPIYDTSNPDSNCTCRNLTYTYYSSEDRRCQPKCPAGYMLKAVEKCPGGSFKFEVK